MKHDEIITRIEYMIAQMDKITFQYKGQSLQDLYNDRDALHEVLNVYKEKNESLNP